MPKHVDIFRNAKTYWHFDYVADFGFAITRRWISDYHWVAFNPPPPSFFPFFGFFFLFIFKSKHVNYLCTGWDLFGNVKQCFLDTSHLSIRCCSFNHQTQQQSQSEEKNVNSLNLLHAWNKPIIMFKSSMCPRGVYTEFGISERSAIAVSLN